MSAKKLEKLRRRAIRNERLKAKNRYANQKNQSTAQAPIDVRDGED